ncbi:hypothetical protein [Thalassoroseus pseudoceratinae]|nr:hypothetical protein [Thalassoroseus pseudoceratinae]
MSSSSDNYDFLFVAILAGDARNNNPLHPESGDFRASSTRKSGEESG